MKDGSQYAYDENVGWINFEPNIAGPNVVATVSEKKLTGFIWAENIGWINFDDAALFGYGIMACKVNFTYLGNFVDVWLLSGPGLPSDLNGSNDVDFVDYGMFADYWLTYCPDDWLLK